MSSLHRHEVAVSIDGGKTWIPAKLGTDLGKYSFREWTLPLKLDAGASACHSADYFNTQPRGPRFKK